MYTVIRLSPSRLQRFAAAIAGNAGRLSDAIGRRIATAVARSGSVVHRLPSWSWPLLVAVAAWPNLQWAARRLLDASEDALGIVALCALILALWQSRGRFGCAPRAALLGPAVLLVAGAGLPLSGIPDPVRALMAAAALVMTLAAIADRDEPIAPYAGLAILALPLLSSLQVHAGFPLRVATAEAGRWLLTAIGDDVQQVGAALVVDGQRVVVDASGSGVQMVWIGLFMACLAGWAFSLSSRAFIARLPLVGVVVLAGNIARSALLVAAEAGRVEMTDAMHAAVSLVAYAAVVVVVGALFADARTRRSATGRRSVD